MTSIRFAVGLESIALAGDSRDVHMMRRAMEGGRPLASSHPRAGIASIWAADLTIGSRWPIRQTPRSTLIANACHKSGFCACTFGEVLAGYPKNIGKASNRAGRQAPPLRRYAARGMPRLVAPPRSAKKAQI